MTATLHPRLAPVEAPRVLVKTGLWRCGFCTAGNHSSCPAMVRNGRARQPGDHPELSPTGPVRLVLCYCCGHLREPRCLDCGTHDSTQIDDVAWQCISPAACAERIKLRQRNDPIYQMIQRCKSDAAVRRRAIEQSTARMWQGIPPDEDVLLDAMIKAKRTPRAKSEPRTPGACECCGEPTKGGRFLPGHDAKLKSVLRARVKHHNDQEAKAELERRGW